MREKLGAEADEVMTIEQLEATADEMAEIFDRFRTIRQRHGI
jgi:hypothetical protein